MVGTFDVKVRTWADPDRSSVGVARRSSVGSWVLGGRYTQIMLAGIVAGQPYNGIGYAGFDNVSKKYVATYMDDGGTGMEWYTGPMRCVGKSSRRDRHDQRRGHRQATPVEMRLSVAANGDHVTELWTADAAGKTGQGHGAAVHAQEVLKHGMRRKLMTTNFVGTRS